MGSLPCCPVISPLGDRFRGFRHESSLPTVALFVPAKRGSVVQAAYWLCEKAFKERISCGKMSAGCSLGALMTENVTDMTKSFWKQGGWQFRSKPRPAHIAPHLKRWIRYHQGNGCWRRDCPCPFRELMASCLCPGFFMGCLEAPCLAGPFDCTILSPPRDFLC